MKSNVQMQSKGSSELARGILQRLIQVVVGALIQAAILFISAFLPYKMIN